MCCIVERSQAAICAIKNPTRKGQRKKMIDMLLERRREPKESPIQTWLPCTGLHSQYRYICDVAFSVDFQKIYSRFQYEHYVLYCYLGGE